MEELSIEEKAKAYDEAKLRMNAAYNSNRCTIGFMNEIFPELKESEDERIRKFIKDVLDSYGRSIKCPTKDILLYERSVAWLEKQGNLMKALQISNAKIGELIEKNYYLKEQLEKQGKNNMGISEATKQKLEDNLNKALEKETPESCNEFLEKQGEKESVTCPICGWEFEKQGEQKSIKEHNACEFCEDRYGCVSPCSMKLVEKEKPVGNVKPKFKVGDIIRHKEHGFTCKITAVDTEYRVSECNGTHLPFDMQDAYELVEQNPTEEYNITGIGSKHATGKLAEKIKELDEKTKELELLKQGEQKPFGQRDECLHCQFNYAGECKGFCAMKRSNRKPHKPADKVEKFKIEEDKWYVCIQTFVLRGKIVVIKGQTYQAEKDNAIKGEDGCLFIDKHDGKASEYFRLWTIQDIKDGDILFTSSTASHETFIFKSIDKDGNTECYFSYDSEDGFREGKYHFIGRATNCKPATKEQRDLLFQKIKEAGYEWDAEKKELKKIEEKKDIHNKLTAFEFSLKHIIEEAIECGDIHNLKADANLLLRIAQKTSWSEEDERTYKSITYSFAHNYPLTIQQQEFVKSLKDRVQPKQEWSEEDKDLIEEIISHYRHLIAIGSLDSERYKSYIIPKLKSLRPQSHWKPSEEQMKGIECTIKTLKYQLNVGDNRLDSLYNDLKKLREE